MASEEGSQQEEWKATEDTATSSTGMTQRPQRIGIASRLDTTYARSLEGILRIISVVVAVVFFILSVAAFTGWVGWNITTAISWIVYVAIVFVIEMLIEGVYVHRLIDGIISLAYTIFWLIAAILCIAFAASTANGVLGAAAFFGLLCTGIIGVSSFLAFRTWQTYEHGTRGSIAIFVI